jgi:toxin ParE1/3/4
MDRTVRWSLRALSDLDTAAEFIAVDSPGYAAAFVIEVRLASRSLVTLPERGRVVPEFGRPNIRELFVHSYRLIYRLEETRVVIAALIHGRRDLIRLWRRERRPAPEDIIE